ncbi:hypothetical protein [Streptomyces lavendulocolor]|uniref:hypothetical protein n=1 Tax=Streptomyces lavendulocolor TaxID=67316 RepID=UPI003C2CC427
MRRARPRHPGEQPGGTDRHPGAAPLEVKIRCIDARMAGLTGLRADLEARVGTGCPRARRTGPADGAG